MDEMVRKNVEVGVDEFHPFNSSRSLPRPGKEGIPRPAGEMAEDSPRGLPPEPARFPPGGRTRRCPGTSAWGWWGIRWRPGGLGRGGATGRWRKPCPGRRRGRLALIVGPEGRFRRRRDRGTGGRGRGAGLAGALHPEDGERRDGPGRAGGEPLWMLLRSAGIAGGGDHPRLQGQPGGQPRDHGTGWQRWRLPGSGALGAARPGGHQHLRGHHGERGQGAQGDRARPATGRAGPGGNRVHGRSERAGDRAPSPAWTWWCRAGRTGTACRNWCEPPSLRQGRRPGTVRPPARPGGTAHGPSSRCRTGAAGAAPTASCRRARGGPVSLTPARSPERSGKPWDRGYVRWCCAASTSAAGAARTARACRPAGRGPRPGRGLPGAPELAGPGGPRRRNVRRPRDAQRRLCPHFHLPLQSGSDAVLERMGRGIPARGLPAGEWKRLRSRWDDPAITTDVMVGFPGETEADFDATLETVEEGGAFESARVPLFPPARDPGGVHGRTGAGEGEAAARRRGLETWGGNWPGNTRAGRPGRCSRYWSRRWRRTLAGRGPSGPPRTTSRRRCAAAGMRAGGLFDGVVSGTDGPRVTMTR